MPKVAALLGLLVAEVANVFARHFAVLLGGLAHGPHLAVALVGHDLRVEGVVEQQIRHPRGVTHPNDVHAALGQLFGQQVHRRVARGAH